MQKSDSTINFGTQTIRYGQTRHGKLMYSVYPCRVWPCLKQTVCLSQEASLFKKEEKYKWNHAHSHFRTLDT